MYIVLVILSLIVLALFLFLKNEKYERVTAAKKLQQTEQNIYDLQQQLHQLKSEAAIDADNHARASQNIEQLLEAVRELDETMPPESTTRGIFKKHTIVNGWYTLGLFDAKRCLEEHWSYDIRVFDYVYNQLAHPRRYQTVPGSPDKTPPEEVWKLGFSVSFIKSIGGVDRKLQGRILQALTDLVQQPDKVHGDTIKPLTGNHKGLWRYRVGDYRLLYQPLTATHEVLLVEFSSRGDAYA